MPPGNATRSPTKLIITDIIFVSVRDINLFLILYTIEPR
jgi:hypothetical protein